MPKVRRLRSLFEDRTGATRRDDYASSKDGAAAVAGSASTHLRLLLLAECGQAAEQGHTDYSAGTAAGLLDSCYWRRMTDLRQEGLIAHDGRRRPGKTNVRVQVSVITRRGRAALALLDED